MIIKAKHVLYVGAFIVLTIIGAKLLPKEEVFLLEELEKNTINSGDIADEEFIYVHIDGAVNNPRNKKNKKRNKII